MKIEKDFEEMRKKLKKEYDIREEIINKSRDILRYSKSSIYSTHRNELKDAKKLIKQSEKLINELSKKIKIENKNNMFNSALQEYVEAICFLNVVENKKLIGINKLGVGVEDYLMGISDLTGELGRRAVLLAIKKDKKGVKEIYDLVDYIFGEMMKFNIRNSELRRKFDAIKWNLKKIEELRYDLSK